MKSESPAGLSSSIHLSDFGGQAALFDHSLPISPMKLPDDLELQALTKFDTLVSQGNLFYEETQGEIAEDKGFKVSDHKSRPTLLSCF